MRIQIDGKKFKVFDVESETTITSRFSIDGPNGEVFEVVYETADVYETPREAMENGETFHVRARLVKELRRVKRDKTSVTKK